MALLETGMRSSPMRSNQEGLAMKIVSINEGLSPRLTKEDGLTKVRGKNEPERARMRRLVVSVPEEEILSQEEFSSAEEVKMDSVWLSNRQFLNPFLQEVDTEDEADEDDKSVLIKKKVCEAEEIRESSSPAPPSSLSLLHGKKVVNSSFSHWFQFLKVDLSPQSISLLEAGESAGEQGIEKLLLVSGVNKSFFFIFGSFFGLNSA